MKRGCSVCILLHLGLLGSARDAKDIQVLSEADATSSKYCSLQQAAGNVDYDAATKDLEWAAGSNNPLYEILRTSSGPADIAKKYRDVIKPGFIVSSAWPIVLSILTGCIFYGIIIWTYCCRCCRCCVRYRKPDMIKKGIFGAFLFGTFITWIVCLAYALGGYDKVSRGVVTAGCSAANLLSDVMAGSATHASTTLAQESNASGDSGDAFIGIIPMDETFSLLVDQLDTDKSVLLPALSQVLDDTTEIDTAVAFADASVRLLKTTMETNAQSIKDNYLHQCVLCEVMIEPLNDVLVQLNAGVGKTLQATRQQVKDQLQPGTSTNPSPMDELRENLKNAIQPLKEVKVQMRDTIGFFVKPTGFQDYADQTYGNGSVLFFVLGYGFFSFFIIIFYGLIAMGCWQFQEKYKPDPEIDDHGIPVNPYLKRGSRCTACAWCNGCVYAINVLLIGGLLMFIAVPISGTCLMLVKLNKAEGINLLKSVGAIDDEKASCLRNEPQCSIQDPNEYEDMNVVLNVVDRCLSISQEAFHAQQGTSLNLLEMISLQTNATAPRQTAYELVVRQAIDPVNEQFDKLADTTQPAKLSSSAELLKLRRIFKDNSIDGAILPDTNAIMQNPTYQAMNALTGQYLFASSLSCANFTPSNDITIPPEYGLAQFGNIVPGIQWTWDKFIDLQVPAIVDPATGVTQQAETPMGQENPTGTCAGKSLEMLTCTDFDAPPWSLTNVEEDRRKKIKPMCEAGNAFQKNIKRVLRTDRVFKCLYVTHAGQRCDPKDAQKQNDGTWSNTCLSNLQFSHLEVDCNLDEFKAYVTLFDERLQKAFEMLDDSVQVTMSKVKTEMRALVDEHVLDPIYSVANQFNCKFMLKAWKGLLEGFCFSGTNGYVDLTFSYLISAVGALIYSIGMYVMWRVMRDNVESFHTEDPDCGSI